MSVGLGQVLPNCAVGLGIAFAIGLGTVFPDFAVGLDQVPRFGLGQCFCVGLGMVLRMLSTRKFSTFNLNSPE